MRTAIISLVMLVVINIIIGVSRNAGFSYTPYYSLEKLYPPVCDENCISKWTSPDKRYSTIELAEGRKFLMEKTNIDNKTSPEEIIKQVGGFLYNRLISQMGVPGDLVRSLQPLQQLQLLLRDTTQKLWCGNFQAIFGFLSTAAGLKNRYVEIIGPEDTHEVNEVFLPTYNKWVMIDVTRNKIMITGKELSLLSTAEYLNYQIKQEQDDLYIIKSKVGSPITFDTSVYKSGTADEYFTKNTFLRYYLEMDLKKVYSLPAKIKRYVTTDPWFWVYDPVNKKSNLLFRIRQFFIVALCLSLFVTIYLVVKKSLLK